MLGHEPGDLVREGKAKIARAHITFETKRERTSTPLAAQKPTKYRLWGARKKKCRVGEAESKETRTCGLELRYRPERFLRSRLFPPVRRVLNVFELLLGGGGIKLWGGSSSRGFTAVSVSASCPHSLAGSAGREPPRRPLFE